MLLNIFESPVFHHDLVILNWRTVCILQIPLLKWRCQWVWNAQVLMANRCLLSKEWKVKILCLEVVKWLRSIVVYFFSLNKFISSAYDVNHVQDSQFLIRVKCVCVCCILTDSLVVLILHEADVHFMDNWINSHF